MSRLLLITLLGCLHTLCGAQQLFSTAGGTTTTAGAAISWSLGEPILGAGSNAGTQITSGFQQGYFSIIIGVQEVDPINLTLFPNPARDFVVLELQRDYQNEIELTVFNLSGVTVLEKTISAHAKRIELDVSSLPAGPYEIMLLRPTSKLTIFKFIKL
jgi:hypothetical protein